MPKFHLGAVELKDVALATVVGIALSLIFSVITLLRGEEKIFEPPMRARPPDGRAILAAR